MALPPSHTMTSRSTAPIIPVGRSVGLSMVLILPWNHGDVESVDSNDADGRGGRERDQSIAVC